jgi:hypothetical protein
MAAFAGHCITGVFQTPEVSVDGFPPRSESAGQVVHRRPPAFDEGTEDS